MMEAMSVHAKLHSGEIRKVEAGKEHMPSVSVRLPSHRDRVEAEAAEQGLLRSASPDARVQ